MNSADGHSRWKRYAAKKTWEGAVAAAVLTELGRWPAAPLARARVEITRCSTTEPDYDGLVAGGKFLLDGLVRAGVLEDDNPRVVGQPVYRWERAKRGAGCVRVVVTDEEGAQASQDAPGRDEEARRLPRLGTGPGRPTRGEAAGQRD